MELRKIMILYALKKKKSSQQENKKLIQDMNFKSKVKFFCMQQYPHGWMQFFYYTTQNKISLGYTKKWNGMKKVWKGIQIINQIRMFPPSASVKTSMLQVPPKWEMFKQAKANHQGN